MKNISLIVIMIFVSQWVMAQNAGGKDPKAKAILDESSKRFKTLSSFEATFTFEVKSKVQEMNEKSKGKIKSQGEKYFVILGNDLERYHNGLKTWVLFKDIEEVTIYDADDEESNINFSKVIDMYKEGYKYVLVGEESVGGTLCDIIDLEPDLTPEQRKTNQVYKIRLHIERSSKRIKRWKTFEKNGNRYVVNVETFKPNVPVKSSDFIFDTSTFKGEIIDLSDH